MSESKHTPGPWLLETVKTSCGICHKIGPFPWRDDKPNHACVYVDYPNHDGYMGPRETELLANARLIAAAPDLLEAMKGIEHFADAVAYRADTLAVALRQWIDAGRAAIAKAEGERTNELSKDSAVSTMRWAVWRLSL